MGDADTSRELIALLQLLHRAREAGSAAELGFIVVNETHGLLPYRQAALWRAQTPARVSHLSGLADPDPQTPYVQWLGAVCRHLQGDAGGEVLRTFGAADLPPALAQDWASWWPAHGLRIDLGGEHALLLAGERAWNERELQLANELAHGYVHAFRMWRPAGRWRQRLHRGFAGGFARRWWWAVPALVLLGALPVRLSVLARAEVVPDAPLLMRAPLSGVIADVAVQPNQQVAKDTLLFELDETSQSGQAALAARERDAAQESYRVSAQLAVTDDKGKLAMAQERAKLEEKTIAADYSSRELRRMQVSAPQAGVVVFSDRNDWLGRAVSVGERVMLLADPARLELDAWLPAADAIDLVPGSRVVLHPNATPTESYEAEVLRVAYKAEATEAGLMAYKVQARFLPGQHPRLGQMGTARLYGRRVPLLYYLLRRPLTALRQTLGI